MISIRDLSWVTYAGKQAEKSDCNKTVGALIVKGGRVIGQGFNKTRNFYDASLGDLKTPLVKRSDWTTHAEAAAIKAAGSNVKGATVYVARVSGQGYLRMAKPCEGCAELLKQHKVSKVVYTTSTGVDALRIRDL